MPRLKAVPALTLVLLVPFLSTPQNAPSASQTASTEESFVPPFYWNRSDDVHEWLKAHESFLQRGDGCSLNVSWGGAEGPGSAINGVALFMIAPGEDDISTLIHDSTSPSGLDIRVGARYLRSGGMEELRIALAFEGAPDNVFDEVTAAEAHSLRDRNWKYLTVTKKIQIGDLRYRYSLSCENGKTFESFLRKPVKHRRHSS